MLGLCHLEVWHDEELVQSAEIYDRTPLAGSCWSDEQLREKARTRLAGDLDGLFVEQRLNL